MVGPWEWKPWSGQMMLAVAKGAGLFAPSGGCTVVDVRDDSDEFNNVRVLEAYGIAAMKPDRGILQRSNNNLFEIPPKKKKFVQTNHKEKFLLFCFVGRHVDVMRDLLFLMFQGGF